MSGADEHDRISVRIDLPRRFVEAVILASSREARDRPRDRERLARIMLRSRERRKHSFPSVIFGEPGWDMILQLYVACCAGEVIDVSYEWRLTSGGNTITETLVEDGVEMLTTYSDDNGELVVKHYCALGTQPVFSVSSVSDTELALALDESANDLHAEHESFVTSMKWTMQDDDSNSMLFTNTIMLNGELTENSALLTRVE